MLSFEIYEDYEYHIYTPPNLSRLHYSTHIIWKLSYSQFFFISCNKYYISAFKLFS